MSLIIIIFMSIGTQASVHDKRVEQLSGKFPSQLERGGMRVSGTPHSTIVINGDTNFNFTAQAEGWPGDGSPGTPYIIDSLDINGFDWSISISNTQVYFTISNCNLTGATFLDGAGIYLYNVSNALLNNNTVSHSWRGIYLDQSSYNTVANNNCTTNARGINLEGSNSNTVVNNTSGSQFLHEAGIWLDNSDSNTLVNNTFMDAFVAGIYLDQSSFNFISNNTCTNTDPHIWIRTLSENNTILWNVFADDSFPIDIDEGTGNVFDYNYWSNYGGHDADSDGIGDVPYTFLGNNDSHPLMYPPTPPTWKATPLDLIVEFSFSFFHLNLNVTSSAPLTWYVNDTLFSIDSHGGITSMSILPIGKYGLTVEVTSIYDDKITATFSVKVSDTSPPSWLIIPIDQELEFGVLFVYQVAAIDLSGIDHWWLNDTIHFSIDEFGVIRSNAILSKGVYGLNITVRDPHGNSLSVVFSVIVEAVTIAPTTTTEPTTSTTEGIDPALTFVLGAGLGGTAVIVIVIVMLRRKS
jgi:parallel beta-helix repeat protein